ncbi:MAG TPA: amidohydrolase family protein [Xanthobacteraceae bacterium]|nr:amidohydrolase family protein [Xanthobacteraceae bacterium]
MQLKGKLAFLAVLAVAASTSAYAQSPHLIVPPDQVIAVKAGHLFDSKIGDMLTNQVILIKGDKVTDVGANLAIPPGAKIIDLSGVTVLPGMIDTHVHVNTGGQTAAQRAMIALANAQTDLNAGFTTVMDMDSRGGYNTVDLRDAIREGYVMGPRMQVVGQSLNQRATNYYPDNELRFQERNTEDKNLNSPQLARAAVREAKLHGVDYIKIYTTQDFVGQMHMWKPDATLVNSPSLDFDEVSAVVDEAHRLGLKVACHTYGGDGMFSCLNAGVDAPNHLLELDENGIKIILEKHETFVPTIDDLIALEKPDLKETNGRNSRLKLMEQAFRRALAAGVTMAFGSGSTSPSIPHGKQGNQFAYFVKWGMSPTQALQMAYLPAARLLNYDWQNEIGSLEKGKFADLIAVSGNPIADVSEMERVKFVMKGGMVVKNDLGILTP